MSSVNKSAAAKRAAAEAEGVAVKIKFLGATLTGPPTLPSTYAFDSTRAAGGDIGAISAIIDSVFDEEQQAEIRALIAGQESDDGGATLVGELLLTIAESYGLDEGE